MKKTFCTLSIILLMILVGYAQKKSNPADYFMQMGEEAMLNNDYAAASDYYFKAWELDRSKTEAEFWVAALTIDSLPDRSYVFLCDVIQKEKDKKIVSAAYTLRGELMAKVRKYQHAIENFQNAIAKNKKNTEAYLQLAISYSEMYEYEKSNSTLLQLLKIDKGNLQAMAEIAKNLGRQEEFQSSIELCDEIIKLNDEFSDAYAIRAAARTFLKEYTQAANDLITALLLPNNNLAFNSIQAYQEEEAEALQLAFRKKINENPSEPRWYYYYAISAKANGQYEKAATNFLKANELSNSMTLIAHAADCYTQLGKYRDAITYCNMVLQEYPTDHNILAYRSIAYDELNIVDSAFIDANLLVELYPTDPFFLSHRGDLNMIEKNYESAIADYTAAIKLDSTYSYLYFRRGCCYNYINQKEDARRDFVQATLHEKEIESTSIAQIAYYFLGNRNEARRLQAEILKVADTPYANFYAACCYSLLGESDKALECVKSAIEDGFSRLNFLRNEPLLENIRQLPEFEKVIKEAESSIKD